MLVFFARTETVYAPGTTPVMVCMSVEVSPSTKQESEVVLLCTSVELSVVTTPVVTQSSVTPLSPAEFLM